MRKGRSSPACSARSQPVLRATPDNKPSRKAPAVARVSALPNTGPIRSLSATSSRSQATSDPDQTATDIDAPPLPDSPRRGPYRQYGCNCSTSLCELPLGWFKRYRLVIQTELTACEPCIVPHC